MSTVYPGARIDCGGNINLRNLFTDPSSVLLPFKDINYLNNCEVSSYIHFAPFFILLFSKLYYHQKIQNPNNNIVGLTLIIILLVEIIYMCCGISPLWAKITQFKYCNRMPCIYGWSALIFTIWGLSVIWENPKLLFATKEKILYPVLFILINFIILDTKKIEYFKGIHSIGLFLLFSLLILFGIIIMLAMFNERKLYCYIIFVLMVAAGLTVNPLARGIAPVTNHPISKTIHEISSNEPDSLWLCTDCLFIISNFAMANGAKVLNATNFYEDKKKWEIIDPDKKFKDKTNRYANQSTFITKKENRIKVMNPDCIHYDINPNTIKKLGIKYLLSTKDYSTLLKKYSINSEEIMVQDNYTIYRLSY